MDNWILENDNLIAMQGLLPLYEGKIDVMPIDPPYNTEIDYVGYKDSNYENGWIAFMRPRLQLAYKLLSLKGVMFIHIDENELFSLKSLCQEIFGKDNVKTLIWLKANASFETKRIEKPLENGIRRMHEYVVVCFKDINTKLNPIVINGIEKPLETVIDNLGTTSSAKDEIADIFGDRLAFSTPKSVRLIEEFIRAASEKDSIIFDFFAGSGTTGHATMALNQEDGGHRKFILITNNESNIFRDVTVPRIQKAIVKYAYKESFKVMPLPDYKGIIGMNVNVIMDRPIGTEHPKHPGVFYPINYGYIDGLIGGDDEEQDVYIMGETESLSNFSGKIIAVIHRTDDVEDKWVAAKIGKEYSIEEIKQTVAFQEKYNKAEYFI